MNVLKLGTYKCMVHFCIDTTVVKCLLLLQGVIFVQPQILVDYFIVLKNDILAFYCDHAFKTLS